VTRIAVLGAGSWGTTFAQIVCDAKHHATLWGRDPKIIDQINKSHTHPKLPEGHRLPEALKATIDLAAAIKDADAVAIAIPSGQLPEVVRRAASHLTPEMSLINLTKAIQLDTGAPMSAVIANITNADPTRIFVVSGPNLAPEIVIRQPAATTIAGTDEARAIELAKSFSNDYFRVYTTTDVLGTEIAGAVKNVVALANGIVAGLGFGENSQSALITRGLAEMTRLGVAMGAKPVTFMGLAGMGDLVATCQSNLSRNRSFGFALGKGATVTEALAQVNSTVEAVNSAPAISELAKRHQVDMPITADVVRIVRDGINPRELIPEFMSMRVKRESI
jgi:glycerol-3-phosphate dehydrogenase (NAD(P)+)